MKLLIHVGLGALVGCYAVSLMAHGSKALPQLLGTEVPTGRLMPEAFLGAMLGAVAVLLVVRRRSRPHR